MRNGMEIKWDRYEEVEKAYKNVKRACPPDIYQHNFNMMCEKIAEFVLKPYWEMTGKKKMEE